jgi:hypothetical protein
LELEQHLFMAPAAVKRCGVGFIDMCGKRKVEEKQILNAKIKVFCH